MQKNKKGMTLIELLAVIAIIAILFILLIPQISNAFEKARLTGVKTDLNDYRLAAKSYFIESEGEDKTAEGLNKHLAKDLRFTDNKSKEKNAWGKPYEFVVSEDKKAITIKTQNKDKEPKEYSLTVSTNDENEVIFELAGLDGSKKGEVSPEEPTLTEEEKTLCESRTITETDASYFTTVDVAGGVSITDYSTSGPKNIVIPCQIGGKNVVDISGTDSSTGAFQEKYITSVVLPNTLKTFNGKYAFSKNQLTSLTIPNSVTSIGYHAFKNNPLTSVTIPNSVTSIGEAAFYNNQLTSVTIGSSVTSIGNAAFYNNQLTSVTIPNSVTSIGESAFKSNKITSVTIPNSIISIGDSVFVNNQLTSVTIPDSVTSIGYSAFSDNQLTSVTIPDSVISIGESVFSGNPNAKFYISDSNTKYKTDEKNAGIYTKDGATIISGTQSAMATDTYNSVTTIGNQSFYNNQITSLTIGSGVKIIGNYAFYNNQLTSVTIPNSVTNIGLYEFYNNPNLKTVINKSSISNTVLAQYFNSSPTITN